MKKFVVILFLIAFLALPSYADDSQNEVDKLFDAEQYVPNEIEILIKNNGINDTENISFSNALSMLGTYLTDALTSISPVISEMLAVIAMSAVFKRINDNISVLSITDVITKAVVGVSAFKLLSFLLQETNQTLEFAGTVLKAWLPSFSSVILLGGGSASSASSAAAFGAVISVLHFVMTDVVGSVVTILGILAIFEKISVFMNELNMVKRIKKHLFTLISFVTTLMLGSLTFQSLLGARADSLAVRTVKFASASFVPIVGNAVGEAMRTVSKGISYVKATLGITSAISLFCAFAPCIITLFGAKLVLTFASFFTSACSSPGDSALIDSVCDIIDILLAIIICVTVLSFLLVVIFVFVTFGV